MLETEEDCRCVLGGMLWICKIQCLLNEVLANTVCICNRPFSLIFTILSWVEDCRRWRVHGVAKEMEMVEVEL